MKLEICVDSYESILNAKNGGADRLELCQALELGGLTPSIGLVDLAIDFTDIELFAMLRPRAGGFIYSDLEFDTIKRDILTLKWKDIDGFVFGALRPDGSLDIPMIKEVVELSYPKKVSLHRAIDYSLNGEDQIDDLIDMGIVRILTSGKKQNAIDGLDFIADLEKRYGDKIEIMAGSGVNAGNMKEIYDKTKIKNFHMSARSIKNTEYSYMPDEMIFNDDIKVANFDMVKEASHILDELKE